MKNKEKQEEEDNTVVSIVVALTENCVIGLNNDLPWHIPADLKHFKSLTVGHPVIMGRKTFESITARLGKALPDRTNIVVSRGNPDVQGALLTHDLEDAIHKGKEIAHKDGGNEVFIIGGGQIFAQSLLFANRIYLTKIHKYIKGDAFFPKIEMHEWKMRDKETFEGDPSYSFITLDRTV